jgi:hypothetical protein
VIEIPTALQAARDFSHSSQRYEEARDLPARALQILHAWKPRQPQAGGEGSQRKRDPAHERFLAEMEEGEAETHDSLL